MICTLSNKLQSNASQKDIKLSLWNWPIMSDRESWFSEGWDFGNFIYFWDAYDLIFMKSYTFITDQWVIRMSHKIWCNQITFPNKLVSSPNNSSSEIDISLKWRLIGGPIRIGLTSAGQQLVWDSLVRNIDLSKSNRDDNQVDLEIQYRRSSPKLGVKSKVDGLKHLEEVVHERERSLYSKVDGQKGENCTVFQT